MDKKTLAKIAKVAALIVVAFVFLTVIWWGLNPFVPTDVRIVEILDRNRDDLLSIDGVIGAGIARSESDKSIIGIAVYVTDDMANVQEIPSELEGFKVFVKRIGETSEYERENMIIHN